MELDILVIFLEENPLFYKLLEIFWILCVWMYIFSLVEGADQWSLPIFILWETQWDQLL